MLEIVHMACRTFEKNAGPYNWQTFKNLQSRGRKEDMKEAKRNPNICGIHRRFSAVRVHRGVEVLLYRDEGLGRRMCNFFIR
jgi:hypothetical protein